MQATFLGLAFFPAVVLALGAQLLVRVHYAQARKQAAAASGYAVARRALEEAGMEEVHIEQIPGELTDHYDPRDTALRLSTDVYHGRTLAAVAIAAQESALAAGQHGRSFSFHQLAAAAGPAASHAGLVLFVLGFLLHHAIMLTGAALFVIAILLQMADLPNRWQAAGAAVDKLVMWALVEPQRHTMLVRMGRAMALRGLADTVQAPITALGWLGWVRLR